MRIRIRSFLLNTLPLLGIPNVIFYELNDMIHIVTRDHKHKEAPTELVARRTPVGDMKIPDPMVLPAAKL